MEMKCGIFYKNMAPHETNKLSNEVYLEENNIHVYKQELKDDTNFIEKSTNKIYNAPKLNNSVSNSSQFLSLPEDITHLRSELIALQVANDDCPQSNEMLALFHYLKQLLSSNINFKSFPNTIEELQNLHTLNLSHNQLTEVTHDLINLKNLESLDLSNNKLENLPTTYARLQKLKQLNISGNKFKSLPECIENGMGTLRKLNISQNPYIRMNIRPYSKYLEEFYGSENNNCGIFPDWILTSKFFNLKKFDLDKTKFEYFNFVDKQGILNVEMISMNCSNLTSKILELMVKNMVNLRILKVGNANTVDHGNVFDKIPIQQLKNPGFITELNFCGTGLSIIPSTINQLCNLKRLNLSLNYLSWLPDEFCDLRKLEYLKINGNSLIMFPENIGNLESLQYIRAEDNILERLPKSFKNLKNLKFIDLYNNKLDDFTNILCEMYNLQGLDFEQNYFCTNTIKIREIPYSILRENYMSYLETEKKEISHLRNLGFKKHSSVKSADSVKSDISDVNECDFSSSAYSDEGQAEFKDNVVYNESEEEENWDNAVDSNDEFEPDSIKINYNKSSRYIPTTVNGFCPADLHSKQIKVAVAYTRAYGSHPTFNEVEGQFDDA